MRNPFITLTVYLFLYYLLLQPQCLFSQTPGPRDSLTAAGTPAGYGPACGSDILLNKLRLSPEYAAKEKAINNAILQRTRFHSTARTATVDYTLPVVFHIINANPSAVTDAAVTNALQAMNDAFSASGSFAGGRTDTRIQFCLAKTDADGGKTTGIVRTKTFLGDYDYDMEASDVTALGRWDPSRYVNIWVVEDIKSEYMQEFKCGVWTRLKMGGYASAGGDIVVAGLGAGLLCHETGHYLSLLHTFANRDCQNYDCATSGDMVCDTPPETTTTGGYPCSSPTNSCSTDTLSGFATDVPDLPDNFMDYGNGIGCVLGFTEGQAERMRNFIAVSLTGMIGSTACTEPCTDIITAAFTTNIDYPVIGDELHLTNTSSGASAYQWLVDGVATATTTDFVYTVTEKRNYTITLRAYGSGPGCFTHSQFIAQVSCGVTARFWPNKRIIASKENIQLDSVFFTNRSIGASSYQWLMSNNMGMAEQVVSTNFHLNFIFLVPATYKIRLIAANGACADTTNFFTLRVDDSSPDAGISFANAECYNQTKVRVTFWFYNNGYKTVPKNTPVSFYNSNPNNAGAQVVGSPYLLPFDIPGNCASGLVSYILDVGHAGLDTLYAVVNDNGSTIPLALPNTALVEKNYFNNIAARIGFSFHVKAVPPNPVLVPGQTVVLSPSPVSGGAIVSAVWSPATNLSCSNCIPTTYIASYRGDTVVPEKVMAYGPLGCYDSAIAIVHVPPVDDYTIDIKKMECAAKGDSVYISFTICNSYPGGNIPADLKASFYDSNPTAGGAALLGTVFINATASAGSCISYTQLIKQSASGNFYSVVNDNGTVIPVVLPNNEGILEKNYVNNISTTVYENAPLTIVPADTTIFKNESLMLSYSTLMAPPNDVIWQAGKGFDLSCNHCASTQLTPHDSSIVTMQLTSRYGCKVTTSAKINIFPPDMTVDILGTRCFTNGKTLVDFRICMNNRYDTVYKNIPVSFYAGSSNAGKQLYPLFYTPVITPGACAVFTHLVETPNADKITAVVNDRGTANAFAKAYSETDYSNNTDTLSFIPFRVSFNPPVIELPRPATIQLLPQVTGGLPTDWQWEWAATLSCRDCENPFASAVSTTHYQVKVKNENNCTDTAMVTIKTFINNAINIPTAFTPNGDGNNDVFYVIGSRDIKQLKDFSIFNRWGQKIFQAANAPANDKSFGWNGTLKGNPAPAGSYVYTIMAEFTDGRSELFKGTIILIR